MSIVNLTRDEAATIEQQLEAYDQAHMPHSVEGEVSIGIKDQDTLIAGLYGCMTTFNIFYVATLFVAEAHRRRGYGRALMDEMEQRAKQLGANTIRLDTFDFQGKEFYEALGYEPVGHYRNDDDGYAEYFFLKRI